MTTKTTPRPAAEPASAKQLLLESDRRYMATLIRRAVGRCEQCGHQKAYRYRACELCFPGVVA